MAHREGSAPRTRALRLGRKVRLALIGPLAGLAWLAISGCAPKPERPPEAPLAIRVLPARHGALTERLDYVGTVHSQREVKVLARIQGTVTALPVAEGGLAKEGAVIAQLSAKDLAASHRRTGAELQRAKAERDHQCHWYRQYQTLGEAGSVSKLVVDRHRNACKAATAAQGAASSSLAHSSAIAAKTQERAPFAGTVLQWLSEPGQNVMPGQPLVLLGNEALEIRIRAVDTDLRQGLRVGTPVLATFGGELHRLRVDEIGSLAQGLGRTVEVRVHLPEKARDKVRHGAGVNVSFVTAEERHAVIVPAYAIQGQGEKTAIFVLVGRNVRRVPVTLGIRSGQWVAIRGALPKAFSVAVSNLEMLSDQARVYPVRAREDEP